MSEEEKNELKNLLKIMKERMNARDLSDEYLKEHNLSTREDIGIGEYAYGITMIPCKWVYGYLSKLQNIIEKESE